MRAAGLIVLALLLAASDRAIALDVLETAFEVHRTIDGEDVGEATTTVELRTDDSCWYWYLRLDQTKGDVTYTEKLIMPSAPESWGDTTEADPGQVAPFRLEDNGRIGVTQRGEPLNDGWLSHGWCFLPGDPTGPHSVEVSIGGKLVHRFEFDVVAVPAELEPDPAPQIRPRTDRTGRFSG